MSRPNIILGGASFGLDERSMFNTPEKAQAALDVYRSYGHRIIDTARLYPSDKPGTSEEILGQTDLSGFTIDTKAWSQPGKHTPAELQKSINESLAALRLPKVHMLYLHWPDTETPLTEVMKGIDAIHKQGKFDQFGISNFTLEQIKQMLSICEEHNYIKPKVYQGQYNILARHVEAELIPLLHENDIAFYAWSPAAGGVLNKKASTRLNSEDALGNVSRSWYGKPRTLEAIDKVIEVAEKHGLTGHSVTLNWVLHHSALNGEAGDGMVFGARTIEQLRNTCDAIDAGPLPDEVVKLLDQIWEEAKEYAPPYNPFAKEDAALSNFLKDRQEGK
ncbi:hypothetical protein H2198_004764 [Neophaeococcomyces mojaviensis]|uniref:Uncharacterized protein n=1 Tax=Neophaeococcomyces mojaviensis TaxID=3383035 RepID=A0ACC3A7Q7_9EURO|nr:hypothetical protein H2198_004764 [Knufia sp. JES_112]